MIVITNKIPEICLLNYEGQVDEDCLEFFLKYNTQPVFVKEDKDRKYLPLALKAILKSSSGVYFVKNDDEILKIIKENQQDVVLFVFGIDNKSYQIVKYKINTCP